MRRWGWLLVLVGSAACGAALPVEPTTGPPDPATFCVTTLPGYCRGLRQVCGEGARTERIVRAYCVDYPVIPQVPAPKDLR